jgi:DNA-binding response OmpR family regulator
LEEYGYENILGYSSAKEIIYALKHGDTPDLLLMDINIKGAKDGIQTAKEILSFCDVPIVFMSAYNDKQTIKEVLDVSLYGFLSKPFTERELYIGLEIAWKQFEEHHVKKEKELKCTLELYEDCFYDLNTNDVYLNDKNIMLSKNQKHLLELLAKNVNSVVSKESLSYHLWMTKEESQSALRTVVYLLRKKLDGIQIQAQSKEGYLLKASFR